MGEKFDREVVAKLIRDMDRVIRRRRKRQRDLLDEIEQKLERASRAAMIELLAKARANFRRMDWGVKAALTHMIQDLTVMNYDEGRHLGIYDHDLIELRRIRRELVSLRDEAQRILTGFASRVRGLN